MTLKHQRMITAGIVAGPLWLIATFALGLTREGFDMVRHPASLLSQGEGGWMMVATFAGAGFLYILAAFGLKRVMTGIGAKWAPIMLGIFGVGLIIGGIFRADPALGFPPGTPPGVPESLTLSGQIHGIAPILAFTALSVFFFILARRWFAEGRALMAWTSIAIGIGSQVLSNIPTITADWEAGVFNFTPLWIAAVLAFLWATVALKILLREGNTN